MEYFKNRRVSDRFLRRAKIVTFFRRFFRLILFFVFFFGDGTNRLRDDDTINYHFDRRIKYNAQGHERAATARRVQGETDARPPGKMCVVTVVDATSFGADAVVWTRASRARAKVELSGRFCAFATSLQTLTRRLISTWIRLRFAERRRVVVVAPR